MLDIIGCITFMMMCMYMSRMLYSQANDGLGCMAYCLAPIEND